MWTIIVKVLARKYKTAIVLMAYLLFPSITSADISDICHQLLSKDQLEHKETKSLQVSHYSTRPSAWNSYLDNTANDDTPRNTLIIALNYFNSFGIKSGYAVDIGAGTGRDTLYLLSKGWHVLAIDYAPKAIKIIKERAKTSHLPIPDTEVNNFEHMHLPEQIDLINSYLAIPFSKPEQFILIWNKILTHLRPGGIFAGSLLGMHDEFQDIPSVTTLSEQQIKCLLWPYEIIYLQHIQPDLPNIDREKHWDIWEFVIKKPD